MIGRCVGDYLTISMILRDLSAAQITNLTATKGLTWNQWDCNGV
jgi:hypothetical protein